MLCDGGFAPCVECRLAQGDGEAAAALVNELLHGGGGLTLFLDFDRTLCSTRGGAPPSQQHSLDADLAALAASHPMYVITRNSHGDDIAVFLHARGVPCAGVRVVRKGQSKAAAMAAVLPSLADEQAVGTTPLALFVDDGVREICDRDVAALPGLFRMLLRRGFVG